MAEAGQVAQVPDVPHGPTHHGWGRLPSLLPRSMKYTAKLPA